MRLIKCDLCQKAINDDFYGIVRVYSGSGIQELCINCGKPVLDFLGKNKLINPNSFKELNSKVKSKKKSYN